MTDEKLYTPKELAERYHVTRHTIYKWKAKGMLPAIQIGQQWYVSATDLADFEDRQRMNFLYSSKE